MPSSSRPRGGRSECASGNCRRSTSSSASPIRARGCPGGAVPRFLEPFYQADGSVTRVHGGAGVGLAIVRGVAKGHGGDVRVVSPANEQIAGVHFHGAAFYLTVAEHAPAVVGATAS